MVGDGKGGILYSQEIRQDGSDLILCRDEEDVYPILSEITTFDIERYFPDEMSDLIQELSKLKQNMTEESEKSYVDEIVGLCQKCQKRNEGQIAFNPFTSSFKFDTAKRDTQQA